MVLMLLACAPTLDGDWTGSVSCSGGDADVAWSLALADDHYEGAGTGGCLGDCEAAYTVFVWPAADDAWRVDLDDCTEAWFGAEADAACPTISDFAVDDGHATGGWADCDLELDQG